MREVSRGTFVEKKEFLSIFFACFGNKKTKKRGLLKIKSKKVCAHIISGFFLKKYFL